MFSVAQHRTRNQVSVWGCLDTFNTSSLYFVVILQLRTLCKDFKYTVSVFMKYTKQCFLSWFFISVDDDNLYFSCGWPKERISRLEREIIVMLYLSLHQPACLDCWHSCAHTVVMQACITETWRDDLTCFTAAGFRLFPSSQILFCWSGVSAFY